MLKGHTHTPGQTCLTTLFAPETDLKFDASPEPQKGHFGRLLGSGLDPKMVKTHKKSFPKCPPGRNFTQTLKKHKKIKISGYADMQSVHACAVQTHFSIFSFFLKETFKKFSKVVPFGDRYGTLDAQRPLLEPYEICFEN